MTNKTKGKRELSYKGLGIIFASISTPIVIWSAMTTINDPNGTMSDWVFGRGLICGIIFLGVAIYYLVRYRKEPIINRIELK